MMSIAFNPSSGAYIYDVSSGTPAADASMQIGDVIIGLNDTTIESWNDVGVYMTDAESGATLTIRPDVCVPHAADTTMVFHNPDFSCSVQSPSNTNAGR
jgi:membrane-associated protease RseP (regulator of RpoE activity)